ncbi:unnamed protein product [Schistocephalus solidus]|uniref:Large ribosomal subunit protein bL36m n=1 Tax=Schistocephalus solidus TaxID=70667 RepID=A0A183TUG0_SCHSO|nr:unnamed protein product [Schistocephalus solidus]
MSFFTITPFSYHITAKVTPETAVCMFSPIIRPYKVEDRLRLRCRKCFFERRDGRLFVECEKHARHRQAEKLHEPITPWKFRRAIWKQVKWW